MSKPRTGPPEAAMRSAEDANMSEVLKGWVTSLGKWEKGDLSLWVARRKDKMHAVPVLLVPDDGSHKVVTVEEWEKVLVAAKSWWEQFYDFNPDALATEGDRP